MSVPDYQRPPPFRRRSLGAVLTEHLPPCRIIDSSTASAAARAICTFSMTRRNQQDDSAWSGALAGWNNDEGAVRKDPDCPPWQI
jgi:hypothetical protein